MNRFIWGNGGINSFTVGHELAVKPQHLDFSLAPDRLLELLGDSDVVTRVIESNEWPAGVRLRALFRSGYAEGNVGLHRQDGGWEETLSGNPVGRLLVVAADGREGLFEPMSFLSEDGYGTVMTALLEAGRFNPERDERDALEDYAERDALECDVLAGVPGAEEKLDALVKAREADVAEVAAMWRATPFVPPRAPDAPASCNALDTGFGR